MKKLLLATCVLLLAAGVTLAAGDRDRQVSPSPTTLTSIGTVQPENPGTGWACNGWDITPTSGNWGGRDESQFAVVWEPGSPDSFGENGRLARCVFTNCTKLTPRQLKMKVLEGLANDDFWVLMKTADGDLLVFEYNESYGGEAWNDSVVIDLPANVFAAGQDVEIKILVTGNAWSGFNTYGQLAVDEIEVLGN